MRKFISIIFLIFYSFITNAQNIPLEGDKVVYEIIVENSNLDKSTLYGECKKFVANNFKSAKNVIQTEDIATGTIICNGYTKINTPHDRKWIRFYKNGISDDQFDFSVQFENKNGKTKMRIYNLTLKSINHQFRNDQPYENILVNEIQQLKKMEGKKREKRLLRFNNSVDIVNSHFNNLLLAFEHQIKNYQNNNW
ncbi:DUF4468 domain-containing protein [Sphingobacterium rhinopitheci]|uniref:DUF4468 domain-containing protein n=1 Tax=Sphingobacterium rhinopitheci TaxID=2781960 RepID=UPI001F525A99|nr:DUF4468 domain-containing protein [Sphingobacterium rhinopitheci]MCI0922516.1 DUF4468 domain-containing protein [Sphingobacterium rhinopitheci]